MKYRLSDLAEVCSSKRIYAKEYRSSGIPFYRGKEIIAKSEGHKIANLLFISEDRYNTLLTKYGAPEENDILISAVGTIGKVYIVDRRDIPFYFKDGNLIRICNYNYSLIDPYYLYYLLKSSCGQNVIKKIEIGSTQKAITIKELSHIVLDIPSLQKQQKISAMFKKIDAQASVNRRLNDNLLELVDTLFDNIIKFSILYKATLNDIGTIAGGGTPSKRVNAYWNGKIPWITPKDLSESHLIFTSHGSRFITEHGLKESSAILFPKGTVLFSSRAPIGYISIAKNNISTSQGFKSIIPNKGYSSEFIYELLKRETSLIIREANGSTFKEISSKRLKAHVINIPSKEKAKYFDNSVISIFKLISKYESENKILKNLKRILLQKYF